LSKIIDTSSVNLTTTERFRFEVAPAAQFRYDDIVVFSDGVKSTTTFTHNNANEQTAMTVDGTTTNFAYDAWGRMTSRTRGSLAAQYAWRYGSFLTNVTSNFPGEAATVNYVYDGLQNRRLKQVNGTNYTWTRYDANGSALADYSNGASYWDIGGRVRSFHGGAEIAGSSPQTGTPSYYLRNHLGSVMATTNASKNIVASYQYTPYGEFLSESTTGDHATFGYTGHRLDRELNHYYAKYRYYNPTTMRWLSRDPLGMVDGPNVYAYVRGNVVHAVDPDGLKSDCDDTHPCEEKIKEMHDLCRNAQIQGVTCGALVTACLACWKVGWKTPIGWVACTSTCIIATTCLMWTWDRANRQCADSINRVLECLKKHG